MATSNKVELLYPLKAPDRLGGVTPVAPGVLWVRMPLDDRLNHINVWLLQDEEGWTLVDTGICSEQTRELWKSAFLDYAHGPLKRIICTHFHPDHVGLAGWIQARTGAEFWITQQEIEAAQRSMRKPDLEECEASRAFYGRYSSDNEAVRQQDDFWKWMSSAIGPLPSTVRIVDDASIVIGRYEWKVIIGRGHSPEHMCLYCEQLKLLISGDQVLPGISSNVSIDTFTADEDPLSRYLESCDVLAQLPPDVLVLPSHRDVFIGLPTRIEELRRGIHSRLARIAASCIKPATGDELLSVIYPGRLDGISWRLAVGEMAAYLNRLQADGRIVRKDLSDGSYRWLATNGTSQVRALRD